jgi:hypothetical protein
MSELNCNVEFGNNVIEKDYVERQVFLEGGGRIYERAFNNGDFQYIPDAQRLPTEVEGILFYAQSINWAKENGYEIRIRPDRRPNGHKRLGILFLNAPSNLFSDIDTELGNGE